MKSIVNISMPDRCPCELAVDNNGWFSPCFAYHGIPAREKEFDRCVQNGTRPDWCPIEIELFDKSAELNRLLREADAPQWRPINTAESDVLDLDEDGET